jgi:hypothetical protein
VAVKKVAILIPSYKRPEVLRHTLQGIYQNTYSGIDFQVGLYVGLNKVSDTELAIVEEYEPKMNLKGIDFKYLPEEANIGKANILNKLFDLYCAGYDYIVTMDNDVYIRGSWLCYLETSEKIDFELMGVSTEGYWPHLPKREECPFFTEGGTTFYTPPGIGGGIMFFHYSFLDMHKWTNHGGVYGVDDAQMCLIANKKYVLHCEQDWLVHDPLSCSTPVLKDYEEKKKHLYSINKPIFPEGWDE